MSQLTTWYWSRFFICNSPSIQWTIPNWLVSCTLRQIIQETGQYYCITLGTSQSQWYRDARTRSFGEQEIMLSNLCSNSFWNYGTYVMRKYIQLMQTNNQFCHVNASCQKFGYYKKLIQQLIIAITISSYTASIPNMRNTALATWSHGMASSPHWCQRTLSMHTYSWQSSP